MPTTASGYLNGLGVFWTPSPGYFAAATSHRGSIKTRLDLWIGVREMFETGSLRHGTGVAGFSDADYIVSLQGDQPTSTTALGWVKDALVDRFPGTTIRVSRPAVVCEFAGGQETVEVVPAYVASSGYWIPQPGGSWMRAHPKDHNQYVNNVNLRHNGGAKKLARLVKGWKYERSVPISSCYLEMRAAKYADGESSWSMPVDLLRFLRGLRAHGLADLNDPTGLNSRFTACSSDIRRDTALSRLDTAIVRAEKAHEFILAGNDTAAIGKYQLLFNQ